MILWKLTFKVDNFFIYLFVSFYNINMGEPFFSKSLELKEKKARADRNQL